MCSENILWVFSETQATLQLHHWCIPNPDTRGDARRSGNPTIGACKLKPAIGSMAGKGERFFHPKSSSCKAT